MGWGGKIVEGGDDDDSDDRELCGKEYRVLEYRYCVQESDGGIVHTGKYKYPEVIFA